MGQLWTDERISEVCKPTPNPIDGYPIWPSAHEIATRVRDEYEKWEADQCYKTIADLQEKYDKLIHYCISLEGQIEVLRRKVAFTIEPSSRKSFEEAAAAVAAEFGNHNFYSETLS